MKNMVKSNKHISLLIGVTLVIAAIMIIFWAMQLGGDNTPRVWRAFFINYLFFTSLAAGLVVWPAIIVTAGGDWMGSLEKVCWAGIAFSVPSLVALVVLWIGSENWVPWLNPAPHREWWLNNNFLFARNLLLQVIFWVLAWVFLRKRYSSQKPVYGAWLAFVYAITFSMIGFDMIMPLEPEWKSMMVGGYYFISGLYIAAAAWAFISIVSTKPNTKKLRVVGKIIFAFCMLTTYLMMSQLLPTWYENQPHEAVFIVPRYNLAWLDISHLLMVMVYLGPIALLVSAWAKRTPAYLGVVTGIILTGMWIERWWIVSAVFEKKEVLYGWPEIAPTLAFLALIIAAIAFGMQNIPKMMETDKIKT